MGSYEKYLSSTPDGRQRWKQANKQYTSSYNQQYYQANKTKIHKQRAATRRIQAARNKRALIPY